MLPKLKKRWVQAVSMAGFSGDRHVLVLPRLEIAFFRVPKAVLSENSIDEILAVLSSGRRALESAQVSEIRPVAVA